MSSSTSTRAPWTCAVVGTFAHDTCTVRWPRILEETATNNPLHEKALLALADEVRHGTLQAPKAPTPDLSRWQEALVSFVGRPWTEVAWYVGEALLYRRILEATRFFEHSTDADCSVDPFLALKQREEEEGLRSPRPWSFESSSASSSESSSESSSDLASLLHRCLWGNRADLSLPSAKVHVSTDGDDLLADDTALACSLLDEARSVGILLDNAGTELFSDLHLAQQLLARTKRVTLVAKATPFFVSDATAIDVQRSLQHLGMTGLQLPVEAPWATVGPSFLDRAMEPELRALLATFDVVIAKGDCNYRRLVGDVPWRGDDARSFGEVTAGFPTSLVALRTCKAEVLVGVPGDVCTAAAQRDPRFLVSGRFGVIQARRR